MSNLDPFGFGLSTREDAEGANVAVVALWSPVKRIRRRHPHAAIVGTLYSVRGVDLLVRTLLANPQINIVVVDGMDLSVGKSTTRALAETLLGVSREEVGDDIPDAAVETLVRRISLQGIDPEEHLSDLSKAKPPGGQSSFDPGTRLLFRPQAPKKSAAVPHGLPGRRISAVADLGDLWRQALSEVLVGGRDLPSQYGGTREYIGLVSVIEDPEQIFHKGDSLDGLPFTRSEAMEYALRIYTDGMPPGEDASVSYTYGQRLTGSFEGAPDEVCNQINWLWRKGTSSPASRGMLLSTWRPELDTKPGAQPPCLVTLWWRIVNGKVHLVANFRSHDIYGGYPLNLAGLCLWQVIQADRLGVMVGTLTVLSSSAHIYDRDIEAAQQRVSPGEWRQPPYRPDARAVWHVDCSVSRNPMLRAVALTPCGERVIDTFEADDPSKLMHLIRRSRLISSPEHGMWVGSEISRVYLEAMTDE